MWAAVNCFSLPLIGSNAAFKSLHSFAAIFHLFRTCFAPVFRSFLPARREMAVLLPAPALLPCAAKLAGLAAMTLCWMPCGASDGSSGWHFL